MTTRKLNNHPFSKCHIEQNENRTCFVSYNTAVIFIEYRNGERFIECSGTYSQTTRKQIGWFLKEYAPDLCYQDMKRIAGAGMVQM